MSDNSILPILQKIPFFSSLDPLLHKEIVEHITMQYYPSGYKIFEQGEGGAEMYIIKSGSISINKDGQSVATLKSGDFFGEIALVSDQARNASAEVIEDSEIFILKKADFERLIGNNQDISDSIRAAILNRTN